MKKEMRDEKPLAVIERSVPLVAGLLVLSVALCAWVIHLFQVVSPAGFLLMVPAAVVTFQTLWLLLNPFALVFDGRLEIRQSWFQHRDLFFLDLNKVTTTGGKLLITYTDGEEVKLNLFGIRPSHLDLLKEKCSDRIVVNAARRL